MIGILFQIPKLVEEQPSKKNTNRPYPKPQVVFNDKRLWRQAFLTPSVLAWLLEANGSLDRLSQVKVNVSGKFWLVKNFLEPIK